MPFDPMDPDGDLLEKEDVTEKKPNRYTVMFHNDNYTTMEFVMFVLMKIFGQTYEDSYKIMMNVHKNGKGNVGNYSYDVANTKATKTESLARENEYPLKCTVEMI